MSRLLACLLSAAALVATTVGSSAADIAQDVTEPMVAVPDTWIVTLKATGAVAPKFEGSGKYGPTGFAGVSLRRPDEPWKFGAPDDGFGFALINTPWLQVGPVGRLRAERDSSDDHKFRGMDDIDYAIEPGVFVEVYPLDILRVRGELRRGFWGHDGLVGNVSVDLIKHVDRITLSAGPRMELGDHDFMDTYFGVSGKEALRNGRVSPYKADGGVKSVGVAAAATYDWTEHWSTTLFGRYNRLTGDAADSPVAKTLGTKNAYTVGLGVGYSFGVNW
ncbi:MAG: MipA/OmpV family protein [Hansschlegelia sp.]